MKKLFRGMLTSERKRHDSSDDTDSDGTPDYLDDYDYVHSGSTDEHRREFLGHAGFMLACLSFVAVIFNTLPAWFAGTCQ